MVQLESDRDGIIVMIVGWVDQRPWKPTDSAGSCYLVRSRSAMGRRYSIGVHSSAICSYVIFASLRDCDNKSVDGSP